MIIWKQQLGLKECPYMERWVIDFKLFSIRLHHWRKSDDSEYLHDHPWWFISWVIYGSYTDIWSTSSGLFVRYKNHRPRWSIQKFPSSHIHTVKIPESGCWTILLCGPVEHDWGFYVKDKFIKFKRYFHKIGHHPCEPGGERQRTSERK